MAVTLVLGACSIPHWPAAGRISSPFGLRMNGLRPDIHHGVDIPLPVGTPVHAMAAGRVAYSGRMNGYGIVVMVDHGGDVLSVYAHLSEARVRTGDPVEARQVVGLSGATGRVTAPHLHFEVRRDGWPEDPVGLLGGPPPGGG
ncbi:MAG TPA: M23 family metallopeptidase [Longimicrobiales bacterium]